MTVRIVFIALYDALVANAEYICHAFYAVHAVAFQAIVVPHGLLRHAFYGVGLDAAHPNHRARRYAFAVLHAYHAVAVVGNYPVVAHVNVHLAQVGLGSGRQFRVHSLQQTVACIDELDVQSFKKVVIIAWQNILLHICQGSGNLHS